HTGALGHAFELLDDPGQRLAGGRQVGQTVAFGGGERQAAHGLVILLVVGDPGDDQVACRLTDLAADLAMTAVRLDLEVGNTHRLPPWLPANGRAPRRPASGAVVCSRNRVKATARCSPASPRP